MSNTIEFTERQHRFITTTYQHPDKFEITIDTIGQVCVFNKETLKAVCYLGNVSNELIIKLFKYMDISAVEDDFVRVVKELKN